MQDLLNELISKRQEFRRDVLCFQTNIRPDCAEAFNTILLDCASLLKKEEISVDYIKYLIFAKNPPNVRKQIIRSYGCTLALIDVSKHNIFNAAAIAAEIKEASPETKTAAVGDYGFFAMQDLLANRHFDYVLTGDADLAAVRLCKYLKLGDTSCLQGIAYLDGSSLIYDEKPIFASDETEFADCDFSLIYTSQNMPYFSSRRAQDKGILSQINPPPPFLYSSEKVLRELSVLSGKKEISLITVSDSLFMEVPERFEKICEGLSRMDNKPPMACLADIKILSCHPEYMELLKNAGFNTVILPAGSGDEKLYKLYNPDSDISDIRKITESAARCRGMFVKTVFVVGGAFETRASVEKSIALTKEMLNLYPCFFEPVITYMFPQDGSAAAQKLSEYELETEDPNWITLSDFSEPIYRTKNMTLQQIQDAAHQFILEISELLKKLAAAQPFRDIEYIINLSRKLNVHTMCSSVLSNIKAVNSYFEMRDKPVFCRMDEVGSDEFRKMLPIRILLEGAYEPFKKGYLLTGGLERTVIEDPKDAAVYEYSAGKLNIEDISKRLFNELDGFDSAEQVLNELMIPFYREMENKYQILFFR